MKQYLPYLDLRLDIGIIAFHTEVMYTSYHDLVRTYIALYWRVWKWNGAFRLYSPMH